MNIHQIRSLMHLFEKIIGLDLAKKVHPHTKNNIDSNQRKLPPFKVPLLGGPDFLIR